MSYKLKREEKRSPKNEEAMLLKLEIEEQHQFATTLLFSVKEIESIQRQRTTLFMMATALAAHQIQQ
ncbi:hypothetical protein [Pectobacterium sp. A5351]|uniref:hypothetical protein n=1 Tax=Pectobacterium sp. A5351 TaxID=2914983 RepID=UPI00233005BB|nr:hypothetical protein [Pectobacterium sp. A5351]WCG82422.1 hypothetical protein O1Q74_16205 [Pectobacterium sp. A5351]